MPYNEAFVAALLYDTNTPEQYREITNNNYSYPTYVPVNLFVYVSEDV